MSLPQIQLFLGEDILKALMVSIYLTLSSIKVASPNF